MMSTAKRVRAQFAPVSTGVSSFRETNKHDDNMHLIAKLEVFQYVLTGAALTGIMWTALSG